MPNPITSAVQDMVTTGVVNKFLGGDKKNNQNQQSYSSSGGGGLLGKISSTISSAINTQQQPMSGGGYPQQQSGSTGGYPQHGYAQGGGYPQGGGGGYPQQQQQPGGYGGGYPPQQMPYGGGIGGYGPPSDGGYNYINNGGGGGGGYPPPQQQPPYQGGYSAGYQPYQPNFGGGSSAHYSSQPYPQNQPYSASSVPYPGSNIGGAPQMPPSSYAQQTTTQPAGYGASGAGAGGGYPQIQTQPYQIVGTLPSMSTPSVRANPNFNPQATAELLRKAMKGFGCDKGKVIQALVSCNNAQRQEVIRVFKQMYGKDLIGELKSELRGDFEDLIMALMEWPACYDAMQLRRAMQGLGTKEHVLIEIMTTRTNAQIHEVKMAYRHLYNADLEREMIGETSGYFKRLLVSLCSGARDESWQTDTIKANQDARRLWRAGEARLGTDEAAFNAILAAQNYAQLRLVFEEYQKQHGHSIEQAIIAEFSGDILDAHLALVKSIRNRPAYFAELLHNSMKGFGTRDTDLIRLVVTRSEIDLADVSQAYQKLYGTPLENAIANDCSGAYKNGLIALVKGFYQ